MAIINEDRLQGRLMKGFGGRIVLIAAAAAAAGFLLGALLL